MVNDLDDALSDLNCGRPVEMHGKTLRHSVSPHHGEPSAPLRGTRPNRTFGEHAHKSEVLQLTLINSTVFAGLAA
jgi:hypothetical protein